MSSDQQPLPEHSVCPDCGRPDFEHELIAAVKVIVGVRDLVLAPCALDPVVELLHRHLGWRS